MFRILNVEPENYSRKAYTLLQQLGTIDEHALSREQLLAQLPQYDVLIVRLGHQIDREVLDAGKNLKAVVSATTGLDHIDTVYAAERNIAVLCLRGEIDFLRTIPATAEHTWGLLLALIRHIPAAFDSVKQGEWDRDSFRGRDLHGKKLGILGYGRIGTLIARYALVFGMQVMAYDPTPLEQNPHVTYCTSMADLLTQSEILTIHVPLNDSTIGLVGATQFQQLPPNALLINTSRGAIVDENAMLAGLQSGHLAGVATDVLMGEREWKNNTPLLQYAKQNSNLIITPHIGGATTDSMAATELFMARKLETYLKTLL